MPRKRGQVGECVYCGSWIKLTLDHIPPKNLFPNPKPKLITVPCCEQCNNQASLDDEYFRLVLNMSEKLENKPRFEIIEKIQRSFQKPEKTKFKQQFISNLKEIEIFSPSGIRLGRKLGYGVDFERVNKVGARIIKGLFYHEHKQRLPDAYDSKALIGDCIDDPLESFRRAYLDIYIPKMKRNGVRIVDKDIFQYCHASVQEDQNSSLWCLIFYQTFIFYGAILPIEFIQTWWPRRDEQ